MVLAPEIDIDHTDAPYGKGCRAVLALDIADIDAFLTERRPPAAPRVRQSLPTIRAVLERLHVDLDNLPFPTISVVGSKGKGTATASASAALCQAGLVVGTVTSPSLVEVRERVRIDGRPLPYATYVRLGRRLQRELRAYASENPQAALPYLGGRAFMLAMLAYVEAGVDAAVVEASMGGRSDATSLLQSPVVAMTEVFGQHLGTLGDTVTEIAVEKVSVVGGRTARLLTLPQTADVVAGIHAASLPEGCVIHVLENLSDADVVAPGGRRTGWGGDGSSDNPLTVRNLELGRVAAGHLMGLLEHADPHRLVRLQLPAMALPGRGQLVPGGGMIDTAVNAAGVEEAIASYRRAYGHPPRVVLGHVSADNLNDAAEIAAVVKAHGATAIGIDLGRPDRRLQLDREPWDAVVHLADVDPARLGSAWLLVGTTHAAVPVLRSVGADTAHLWERAGSVAGSVAGS